MKHEIIPQCCNMSIYCYLPQNCKNPVVLMSCNMQRSALGCTGIYLVHVDILVYIYTCTHYVYIHCFLTQVATNWCRRQFFLSFFLMIYNVICVSGLGCSPLLLVYFPFIFPTINLFILHTFMCPIQMLLLT